MFREEPGEELVGTVGVVLDQEGREGGVSPSDGVHPSRDEGLGHLHSVEAQRHVESAAGGLRREKETFPNLVLQCVGTTLKHTRAHANVPTHTQMHQ